MAVIVKEIFKSRVGSRRGLHGAIEPRLFSVRLDVPPADRTELRMHDPKGVIESFYPFGTWNPWNNYCYASDYGVVDRLTQEHFICEVMYSPITAETIAYSAWVPSIRGSSITQDVSVDIDGRDLGTPVYVEHKEGTFGVTLTRYNAVGVPSQVSLKLKDSGSIAPFTAPVDVPGFNLTMNRYQRRFDASKFVVLSQHYKKVNSTTFMGAPPGHVKFDDVTLDMVPGQESRDVVRQFGITRANLTIQTGGIPLVFPNEARWNVSLSFIYSAKPFSPFQAVHQYSDQQSGGTGIVTQNGERQVTESDIIVGADFSFLFRALEA